MGAAPLDRRAEQREQAGEPARFLYLRSNRGDSFAGSVMAACWVCWKEEDGGSAVDGGGSIEIAD